MEEITKIRFIATNFSNLQGLRMVPLGMLLVFVCLVANAQHGSSPDWISILLSLAVTLALIFVIDRYYLHKFGRVRRTAESVRLETIFSIVFGILALFAIGLEMFVKFPFSSLGLLVAVGLLADYIRINWLVKGHFLFYYPLGAFVMAVLSVLPLFGVSWWRSVAIHNQYIGITMIFGVIVIIAGVWGHIFLVRTLSPRGKQNADTI
jgi:hypothetical protein